MTAKDVTVTADGVRFGDCWVSHETISGCTAERLNSGDCGIIGRQYMAWVRAAPASPPSEKLREVLRKIESGSLPGIVDMVLAGDWQAVVDLMQAEARAALGEQS